MIRTKTAIIIGAGAGVEIEMPGERELLSKIAHGFDFQRLGSDLQTREMQDFDALFKKVKGEGDKLREAALRIRAGSRLTSSIHALLQQHGEDKHVLAVGKLAIAYYTLQAEQQSAMEAEPRDPGEMPFRGAENWLFQLGRMVVDGVSRSRAQNCFDNLHIVNFNTDRSIQHYMPWVLHSGFGMPITEAQAICAEKLNVVQPFGRAGRLDWQTGSEPVAAWGEEKPGNFFKVAETVRTASEFSEDRQLKASMHSGISGARRLVFIGFNFNSLNTSLLFQEKLSHGPETLVALGEDELGRADGIRRLLKTSAGIAPEMLLTMRFGPSWQMLADNDLLLES
ncbi:hypothetical protein [Aurantiacibacter rhizosphaerae]|uniref:SIR2-like domain-containing protein n=1 Tax=Aurantiacibacter rhizosphaerae TaxID=2691582 RepID=A0A844XDP3_9SPHN|nr:hypothetical protein [Aurantiacibacter rhizosphaerae]MWV27802.1 hypothetical protein [Aurantiacibacter rhizosphaerae]